jgi:hypothetical protein
MLPVGRRQRTVRQRGAAADAEKAGGRYADGSFLRLPARSPVPSRSTPSLHQAIEVDPDQKVSGGPSARVDVDLVSNCPYGRGVILEIVVGVYAKRTA